LSETEFLAHPGPLPLQVTRDERKRHVEDRGFRDGGTLPAYYRRRLKETADAATSTGEKTTDLRNANRFKVESTPTVPDESER